ncbi:hypothetical protein ACS0TY_004396 [Phlomoides rotata]
MNLLFVVDAVKKECSDDSAFGDYARRCRLILGSQPGFSVHFVHRNANVVAHCLARTSHSFTSPFVWIDYG